jgi:hypothetical protein
MVGAEWEPGRCREPQLTAGGEPTGEVRAVGVADLALCARPSRGDGLGDGVRRDARGHPEPQTDAFTGPLHLEDDVAGGTKQVALGGQHRVEVPPEGERTLRLDDSRHRHLDELANGRWPETAKHSNDHPGGHQPQNGDHHRHGDGQDLVGEVGEMVAGSFHQASGWARKWASGPWGRLGDGAGAVGGNGILL